MLHSSHVRRTTPHIDLSSGRVVLHLNFAKSGTWSFKDSAGREKVIFFGLTKTTNDCGDAAWSLIFFPLTIMRGVCEMLLKYTLTDSQYQRFQHDNNNAQIQALGKKAGVEITEEKIVGGIETMFFRGRCNGTMALVPCTESGVSVAEMRLISKSIEPHHWECWIRVQSKPWWLPWFVLDWGFREALK